MESYSTPSAGPSLPPFPWRVSFFGAFLLFFPRQAIQAHVGLLMDAVLSPAPDEENAQAIASILDRCEEQHKGAGATLALGYLDTVWWLPAPVRPEIGALAILAVYEALKRFGVFTRCDICSLFRLPFQYSWRVAWLVVCGVSESCRNTLLQTPFHRPRACG